MNHRCGFRTPPFVLVPELSQGEPSTEYNVNTAAVAALACDEPARSSVGVTAVAVSCVSLASARLVRGGTTTDESLAVSTLTRLPLSRVVCR